MKPKNIDLFLGFGTALIYECLLEAQNRKMVIGTTQLKPYKNDGN